MGNEDDSCVLPATRGEQVDWDQVYRRHAPDLRKLIAGRLRQAPEAVDDVLQDTFVRAFRGRSRLDPTDPLWPWLATIAHRACSDLLRHHTHPARTAHVPSLQPCGSTGFPGSDDHLADFSRVLTAASALRAMSPRHRRVLYLHAAYDMSCEHLAATERTSPKAVKSALARARAHFRVEYDRLLDRSAIGIALGRAALMRLRARLGNIEASGCERMLGAAVSAVLLGVLVVPARSDIAGTQLSTHVTAGAVAGTGALVEVPDLSDASAAAGSARSSTPGSSDEKAEPGSIAPRELVQVGFGGVIEHSPQVSSVGLWLTVDDPARQRAMTVGTEVYCERSQVTAAECAVLRAVPQPPTAQ